MTKKIPIFWLLLFFPMLSSGYDFSNLRNTPMQWVDGTLLLPSRWYLLSDKELNDKGHVFEESHESDSALLYYGILAQRLESRLANKVADTNDIHLYIKIRNLVFLPVVKDSKDVSDWYFLNAYHVQAPIGSDLFKRLEADYYSICSQLRRHIETSPDGFIHTSNGELIQIRSKDAKDKSGRYHPIFSKTYNRFISNKNHSFYFKKEFMREFRRLP